MARKLAIEILGDASHLEKTFKQAGQSVTGFNASVGNVGKNLTKTLTPAAGAIALLGKKSFDEWRGGLKAIQVGTGATGKDLRGMESVMKSVAGRSTASMSEIGLTVADLNTRLGLTGKPLEAMTKKFADLQRLNMPADVGEITRVFGDWAIETADQARAMDKLFAAGQKTGIGLDKLSGTVVQFGAPLRQLGFSFEESVALLGKFEKEGVNVSTVMSGMRQGLARLAKAGEDPPKALARISKEIKAAGSTAKANALAIEAFGARAGPDMAAAIKEGRFEIADLVKQLDSSEGSIDSAAKATLTLSDKMTMLKNRVFAATGPFGELLAIAGGGLAAIGPTLFAVGQMGPALAKLSKGLAVATKATVLFNVALLANPIFLTIAAVVALGVGLVVLWKKSETFRKIVTGAFEGVAAAANAVLGFFRTHWKTIAVLISGPFAPLVALATDAFGIRSALVGAFKGLARAVKGLAVAVGKAIVSGVLEGVKDLPGALKGTLEKGLKGALGKLNPFSPVSHGGRIFIGEEIVKGAIEGVKATAPKLADALDVALRNAVKDGKKRTVNLGVQLGGLDTGLRNALADQKKRLSLGPLDIGMALAAPPQRTMAVAAAGGNHRSENINVHLEVDGQRLGTAVLRNFNKRQRLTVVQKRGLHAGKGLGLA